MMTDVLLWFLQLLQLLQSNLTGFKELHILNFRNGSVLINNKMNLAKPLGNNLTQAVRCTLDDFSSAASKKMDSEIDTQSGREVQISASPISPTWLKASTQRQWSKWTSCSLGDHGDPCKYIDCNEFSHCVVNTLTTEAECLCDPGYNTVDGLPCQSICNLQPNYCLNGGLCENIPGHGASCRYLQTLIKVPKML